MLSFKYRIYPTKKEVSKLTRQMRLAKEVHNLLLEKSRQYYKDTGKTFSQYDMNNHIRCLKAERPDISEVHSQVLQNISKRVGDAYQAFFRRAKERRAGKNVKAGFPRSKKFVSSLSYPQSGFSLKNKRRLYLSGIGNVPIVLHRLPKGQIKTCTIKHYRSGEWYVGLSNEIPATTFHSNGKEMVDLDVGLKNFVTLSNGQKVVAPRFLRLSEERIKLMQRRVSRKKKGSQNRKKACIRLSMQHEKVSNQRLDFLHKLSRQQVVSYSKIAVENLNVKGMVRNHHLAKSIVDASWGVYVQLLHYKAWSAGCEVVDVDPEYTTQECSNCGKRQKMELSERIYMCPACEHTEDRDLNAAKNILKRATVGLTGSDACGDLPSTPLAKEEQGISLKQELYGAAT